MFIIINFHLHLVITPWLTPAFVLAEYFMAVALKDALREEVAA